MAKEQTYKDTIRLNGGHALILGHKPTKLTVDQVQEVIENNPQDVQSFGLFDAASPNYTTFYPDVTAEDLQPKDEDFVEPIFRMLSNVTVNAKSNPIHFPSKVLKANMHKMVGQSIYVDHEMATGNSIGSVKSVSWQNAYKANGVDVPAGFNAVMKIDGKSNPRLARGIMMDPPSIHSNSVTVTFAWKKSHPKMADDEFWSKVGTLADDGKLVQRVVSDIEAYHETSLVPHGADPFAQKVGSDGKITNPGYASSRYNLADTELQNEIKCLQSQDSFCWNWKSIGSGDTNLGIESFTSTGININNQNNKKMDEVTLRLLETIWGLEVDSLTEENFQEILEGLATKLSDFTIAAEADPDPVKVLDLEGLDVIEAEITSLRTFKEGVPEDYEAQIALSAIGGTAIKELRAETTRLYNLTIKEEETPDANILSLIDGANYETLQSLHKQYDKLTDEQFNFECTECGSHDVTRSTADASGEGDDKTFKNKSSDDVIEKFTGSPKVDMRFITGK